MPRHVFLDTEVFDSGNFDFESKLFQKLISLVESKQVCVYLTDITRQEILSHLKQRAAESISNLERLRRSTRIVRNRSEFSSYFREITRDKIADAFYAEFQRFCDACKVTVIPIDQVNVSMLIGDYFNQRPPFGDRKKNEFPDAIAAAALQDWARNNFSLHIVSADSDWKSVCESSSCFTHCERLGVLLAAFADPEVAAALKKGLKAHHDTLIARISKDFEGMGFFLTGLKGAVTAVKTSRVELKNALVIEAIGGRGKLDLECMISYSVDVDVYVPNYWTGGGERYSDGETHLEQTGMHTCGTYSIELEVSYDIENPEQVVLGALTFVDPELEVEGDIFINE